MPHADSTTIPPPPAVPARPYDPIKRLIDVAASGLGLILLAPVMLLVAGIIRSTSRGPALYRARRAGAGGKPFAVLKFRTMVEHADRAGVITAAVDPRITPLGRWLRRTKLDELPQLLNILRGEMSLVGPRPESLDIVREHFTAEQLGVLAAQPGLTCTGTLYFYLRLEHSPPPPGLGPEEFYVRHLLAPKISGDLHYVRHRTLAYDLQLLAQTARVVAARILGLEPSWSPPAGWRPPATDL